VQRLITALRGLVRSGNSGGPVVDRRGRVLATVFAAARHSGSGSGFGVPDSIVRRALGRSGRPVGTGACAH
jgi:S1-C subfamily serine protease